TEVGTRSRLTTRSAPSDLSTPVAKFDAVAHAEVDNAFRPFGGVDPWYWGPTLSEGGSARTESVPLPGLASGTDPVHVTVRWLGRNEEQTTFPDHKSRITLLNSLSQPLAVNGDNGTFDGRMIYD